MSAVSLGWPLLHSSGDCGAGQSSAGARIVVDARQDPLRMEFLNAGHWLEFSNGARVSEARVQ